MARNKISQRLTTKAERIQRILSKGAVDAEEKESSISSSVKDLKAMQKAAKHLCEDLFCELCDFNAQQWIKNLSRYISTHDRLLYSSISDSIFISSDDSFSFMSTNLESAIRYLENTESKEAFEIDTDQLKSILLKFYDHANLAHRQSVAFHQTESDIANIVDRRLESETSRLTKEMTSQLVGLVAIFTALSFIIFGAMSSLDSTLDTLAKNVGAVLPTLIVVIGWAFCILNLLFAFMYFVFHITKIKPPLSSDNGNLVQKYPLVFLCNFVLFVVLAVCVGSWAAIQTGVGSIFYDWALEHGTITFIAGVIVVFATACFFGRKLWKLYKYPEIRYEIRSDPEE